MLLIVGCGAALAAAETTDGVRSERPSFTVVRSAPPGDPLPRVLFITPINATWAANHADAWKGRGVSGFLFQGILDDLSPFSGESPSVPAADAAAHPDEVAHPPQWEALIAEITAARRRLTEGGLDSNFLRMALSPESALFCGGADASRARDRFALAGQCCALAGLRGLALDTVSGSPLYDLRWDGYRAGQPEEGLRAGARRFAVRAVRAFIRACPKGDILLLADSLDQAGPLWFSFFEGAVEALGSAAELRIRLVLRETAALDDPGMLAAAADRINRRLEDHLDTENRARWARSGGIVLCLEPAEVKDNAPRPRYSMEQFRRLRGVARLRSSGYVCVNAPDGGWWPVPDDAVDQFAGLRQGGAARVRPMPAPPAEVDAFTFHDPFDGACHIGRLPFQGADSDVLADKDGAMVVAWQGLREPLRVDTRQALIPVVRLDTEQKDYVTPKDGAVILPATDAPVLVGGLPLRDYALPASMWMRTGAPFEAGTARNPVRFGLRNPSPATLRGNLRLLPPETHSVGAALFPLSLVPGEKAAYERTLQGTARLGGQYRFTMACEAPDLAPVSRVFDLTAAPARVWRECADAAPNGAPVTARDAKTGVTRVFWASCRGDVGCGDLRGGMLWKQRVRENITQGPVSLATAAGAVAVTGDDAGRLWFFDGDGGLRLEAELGGEPVKDALRTHAFAPDQPESVLALLRDGTLVRLAQVGTEVWRTGTGLRNGRVGRLFGPRGVFGALCTAGVRTVKKDGTTQWAAAGVDAEGGVLWHADLPAPVACGPVSEHTAGAVRTWRVGLANGAVVELDAEKGGAKRTWRLPGGTPVTALSGPLAPDDARRAGVLVVAANAAGVFAHGPDDAPLWTVPLPGVRCMAASPGGEMVVAGTDAGELVCIDAAGTVRWRDTRATGAVLGIATLPVAGGRCAVLHAAADGFVTALDGGPVHPDAP